MRSSTSHFRRITLCAALLLSSVPVLPAATIVYLTGVPDYGWYYGCMGTAAGNLMGFWDRHGFPDFYTGQANGGVAPLNTAGDNVNVVSMWASKAGLDGRRVGQPGHVEDYYVAYNSLDPDPFLTAGREEHTPDCLGDFIGLSQRKWTNLAGECDGNVDGFCFVYWATNGDRRVNFVPDSTAGLPPCDVQSGLRAWTLFRGYDCQVFTQLTDFNPTKPVDKGFTFDDLKSEIDAGYPVLLFLQDFDTLYRTAAGFGNVNPMIHSMLAYGYYISGNNRYVRYRTSWASGDTSMAPWNSTAWEVGLPARGVIAFHPQPKIRSWQFLPGKADLSLQWDGPCADLYDSTIGGTRRVHGYVVELGSALEPPAFTPISSVLMTNTIVISNCPSPAYVRIKLVNL